MVTDIDHVEIGVSDATETKEFLETLGFELDRETDHHGTAYELSPAGADRPVFEIYTVSGTDVPGINHLALAVEDIEGTTEALREAGVADVVGPKESSATGRQLSNFRDPDGRRWQIVPERE